MSVWIKDVCVCESVRRVSMARFLYQYLFFLPGTLLESFAATRALANG